MIISINNLQAGIEWWLSNNGKRRRKFPEDFHNADYDKIYKDRDQGVMELWWEETVNQLAKWRGFRGPISPNSKVDIKERGVHLLPQIETQYKMLATISDAEPSIENLRWEDLADLYEIVSKIKPRSTVFASKTCHFLFPKLFIVMDNTATSVSEYELYWRGMRDAWNGFKEQAQAKEMLINTIKTQILINAIKSDTSLNRNYPLVTKIMELSHIGHKQIAERDKSVP